MRVPLAFASCLAAATISIAAAAPDASAQGRFFLRAGAGASLPSLENLDNELGIQGRGQVDPGYALGVSLGRSFLDNLWSLEIHFSTAFYADFEYENEYEGFTGRLRHYNFMGILRRHWRPEAERIRPSVGLGAGYGTTNLVAGGGKIGAPEALAVLRIDSPIRENLSLSIEGVYTIGLQKKAFRGPFLENVDTDAVMNSAGYPLEDKYDAFDVRIGITARLKAPVAD